MPQLEFDTYTPQLVWLAITFILLYLVMWRVALPRIAEVLEERQGKLQHDLDEADRLKGEAETALSEYDAALGEARGSAHAIVSEARAKLTDELDQHRQEVEADLAEKTQSAEAAIQAAKQEAMAGVRAAALDTTSAVVARLSGNQVDDAAVGSAVDAAMSGRA